MILYYQKLQCVDGRLTQVIKQQKNFLENQMDKLKACHDGDERNGILKSLTDTVFSWATGNFTSGVHKLVGLGGQLFGGLASVMGVKGVSSLTCLQECEKVIRKVNDEIQKLEDGVFQEPISGLEKQYVKRKNDKTIGGDLQYVIENNLINSRKATYPFPFIKQCLEDTLSLPGDCKRLSRTSFLLAELKKQEFFKNYNSATQKQLEVALLNIARSSEAPNVSEVSLRQTFYFFGEAGLGKSTAAQELMKFLDLPFFRVNIRTVEDLAPNNLEGGGSFSFEARKVGWLSEALLAKNSENRTYKNCALILDDFDRILLDPGSSVTSLAFFLEYLDPLKKFFNSPYFRSGIDISRMHIFVTGNHPLPNGSEYQALRERFTSIVEFKSMSEHVLKKILKRHLRDLETYHSFQVNDPKFEDQFLSLSMELAEHPSSLRSLKNTLSDLVANHQIGETEGSGQGKRRLQEKVEEMRQVAIAARAVRITPSPAISAKKEKEEPSELLRISRSPEAGMRQATISTKKEVEMREAAISAKAVSTLATPSSAVFAEKENVNPIISKAMIFTKNLFIENVNDFVKFTAFYCLVCTFQQLYSLLFYVE